MSHLSNDDINKILKEKYELLNSQKNLENRILNVIAAGKCLYQEAETIDDIYFVAYYIPTKEELYLVDSNDTYITNPIPEEKNLYLVDIRSVFIIIDKQNLIVLESLVSPHSYCNIKYEELIKYDIITNKIFLLGFNAIKMLFKVQNNANSTFNDFVDYMIAHASLEGEGAYTREERKQALVDFIANIINLAEEDQTKEEQFLQDLTPSEYKALISILKESNGNDYYLSISNLITSYHISRPAYTSLLNKLKDFKIAVVENRGTKGTYINFFNKEYLNALLEDN